MGQIAKNSKYGNARYETGYSIQTGDNYSISGMEMDYERFETWLKLVLTNHPNRTVSSVYI